MTIEVKDGRFFSRWYFAGGPNAEFDVLAAVWRDPGKAQPWAHLTELRSAIKEQ